jgi:formylglycine-generating enzyme required for sulfatase activity
VPETPQGVTLDQDTPVVGTPPVGQSTQTLSFLSSPAVDPTLDAMKTTLAQVDGGTFLMGTTIQEASEAVDECALYGKTCDINSTSDSIPAHQTTVDSFQMEIYEVTVVQYVAFLNWKGPNSHKTGCLGQPCALTTAEQEFSYIEFDGTTYAVRNPQFYGNHPVTFVTWNGAEAYCDALNRRLPTEAEWERAARGPQNFTYPWGFDFDVNKAMSSALPVEQRGTVEVTTYPNGVSPYGMFNMAGNVEEWVSDWYSPTFYSEMATNPVPNPKGPPSGTQKVLRGGSWDTAPLFSRSVHRRSMNLGETTSSVGLRCVEGELPAAVPQVPASQPGGSGSGETAPSGAPTLAPAPTRVGPPVPTPTLSPG